MTKPLTSAMAQALRGRRPLALLAEIEHPSGVGRFWTGIGTLQWNGFTWTGVGKLGGITPRNDSLDLSIQEIRFQLSGVDQEIVNQLSDDVRNLVGTGWLACLDDKLQVIPDPYQLINSLLDFQTFTVDDNGQASISIIARTGFYTLERTLDERWTPQDRVFNFPNDSGFDLIPLLVNQEIQWLPA